VEPAPGAVSSESAETHGHDDVALTPDAEPRSATPTTWWLAHHGDLTLEY